MCSMGIVFYTPVDLVFEVRLRVLTSSLGFALTFKEAYADGLAIYQSVPSFVIFKYERRGMF